MTATQTLRVFVFVALAASCGGPSERPDGGGVSDSGPTSDASPFGTSCTTSADCAGGGYCIEGYGGHVCTYPCDVGCPEAWQCRATKVDGQEVSVCVPPDFNLCVPCSANSQCGDGVCVTLGGSPFCLPHCPFEGECPQGYTCGPDPSGQNAGSFCVPMTGGCTCTTGADEGLVRTCTNTNSIGTCQGLETCHPSQGGWTGCTAPGATVETCNGLDDDCNMLVDDGVASGQACMITVPGVGSCPGTTICTGASGTICNGPTPSIEKCNYADDDCDGVVDNGFTGVNNVCSAGVGGCERFGVIRCNAAGTGTECSAVAGTPTGELCNGLDDDCDGVVDDGFPTLNQSCTVGVGVCQRQGNYVCASGGAGVVCSVSAGTGTTEVCNLLDDDCDGIVDDGFRDPITGVYNQDRACGSCAVDCTVQYGLPNAYGTCNTSSTPTCQMNCNPGAFNLDGAAANGCEFILDPGAIYVSTNDAAAIDNGGCGLGPVGTGAGNYPCKTITFGLSRAQSTNRARVLVANGIYNETVTLLNGKNLLGGYRPDNWVRDVASTGTIIIGVFYTAAGHARTVYADGITSATLFEGFVVYGAVNTNPNGNSYAIYVSNSNGNLSIKSNVIFGGRGGPGTSGIIGSDGFSGADGSGRSANLGTNDAAYDAKVASGTSDCDATNSRQYSNGGVTSCPVGDVVNGGNGGGNACPAAPNAVCTGCSCNLFGCGCSSCTFVTQTSKTGFAGQPGAGLLGGGGGAGAARGDDMINKRISGNDLCFIPTNGGGMALPTYGQNGANGLNAQHGTQAAACSATLGSVSGGDWIGSTAGAGIAGGNGGGGGGGGAGGGSNCDGCPTGKDNLGGHGGGGGAGGCGGLGGGGATSGGGAFGIFIVGGSAPVVTGNSLIRGEGGVGGAGGAGGKGGTGGTGALGGTTGVPVVFCSDTAGRGGNGGDGGHGSGGGGGCGGSSFGIFTSGVGSPNYCSGVGNTFSGGNGGAGGPGGYSIITPGPAGANGALTDCSFN